jgi:hypothetical protein
MNGLFKSKWKFLMFPFIALAFILIAGAVVMTLWNGILPSVISSVGTLTYTQAIGLLILCRLLFGGFKGGGPRGGYRSGPPWRRKMMSMSEEEREKFKTEWRERCGRNKEDQ